MEMTTVHSCVNMGNFDLKQNIRKLNQTISFPTMMHQFALAIIAAGLLPPKNVTGTIHDAEHEAWYPPCKS